MMKRQDHMSPMDTATCTTMHTRVRCVTKTKSSIWLLCIWAVRICPIWTMGLRPTRSYVYTSERIMARKSWLIATGTCLGKLKPNRMFWIHSLRTPLNSIITFKESKLSNSSAIMQMQVVLKSWLAKLRRWWARLCQRRRISGRRTSSYQTNRFKGKKTNEELW